MESSFWVRLTEKEVPGEQNWGHRKRQEYLKLLTSVGKPQQGGYVREQTRGLTHARYDLHQLSHSHSPFGFILLTFPSPLFL